MAESVDVEVANARGRMSEMDGYPHHWVGPFPTPGTPAGADPTDSPGAFGAALAELALTIKRQGAGTDDDGKALAVIAEGAVSAIGGAQHAAVVVLTAAGQLEAPAAHGDLPALILQLQNEIGEGPTLDAVTQTGQIVLRDVHTDTRWPAFTAGARQWGVRSILCTPLAVQDEVFGSLSLLSTQPDAFDSESAVLAAVFAAHATLALSGVRQVRHLNAKADSRDIIGQAKGILMERHKLTSAQAFQTLIRLSQNHNIKLRALCEQLTSTSELPGD
ncbi:GAF domain-containing protein [Nakamurella panacisegetis]|uniref:GAF domain-containing protein n=1 Tax=Nakamurella panacisegetis TaxID=1090615 RepID=A0A1H0RGF7_9ACTN|nr:GAF and ANTAR domain-containing protein [Nakamurella panacisegetis]SDP28702.1 GAF domain-containing protein [Nakamurella panacisegetis]